MTLLMDFRARIGYYIAPTLLACMIDSITAIFFERNSVTSTLDCWFPKNSTGHHCIISAELKVGIRSMVRLV